MAKLKIAVYWLVVIVVLSLSINLYQWAGNLGVYQENQDYATRQNMASLLSQMQMRANNELDKLNSSLLGACQQLSTTGLDGAQARKVLSDLVDSSSLIVNAATADAKDVLVAVEPSNYSNIEGQDISAQEQNIRMHQIMQPAMSNMIPLVEGFPGVVMVAPIFDANLKFIGSLSIVIQPYIMLQQTIAPATEGTGFSMWAMQTNATLIYDPDPAQQNKNLLTDPIYVDYPEVQTFTRQVAAQQAGYGTYQYYNLNLDNTAKVLVSKEAYWTTIGIYGAEWRLVITHIIDQ